MITNINKIAVKIKSGTSYWISSTENDDEALWIKNNNTCSNCSKELTSGDITCPNCGSRFIASLDQEMNSFDYEKVINEDYAPKKTPSPIKKAREKEVFCVVEHSLYRFDILKVNIKVSGQYVFKNNPYYIAKSKRSDDISYNNALVSRFCAEYKIKNYEVEFISCFSYDLDKKPNERLTLEVDKVGNFLEINKSNIYNVYQYDRCSDVNCLNSLTPWIRSYIHGASASKLLKNTLLAFEGPSLKAELAIKHNLSVDDMIIKNKDATKLHEILGVSKSCLKFIIDPDFDKYSEIEINYKTRYKKQILELYHKLGDNYRSFFKDMEIFFNDEESNYSSSYTRDKLTDLYLIGYNMDRLHQYLTEECLWQQGLKFNTALNELSDYVRMCEEMELKDYDRYPKALRTKHDIIVMRYNSIRMNSSEEKDFNDVVGKYKKLEYKTSKYILKIAKNPKELVQEGNNLSHCVGSYASKMANEQNIVFFLRDANKPDESLVTIEVLKTGNSLDGFKLKLGQCKGAFNRNLSEKEKAFMSRYSRNILSTAFVNEFGEVEFKKQQKENKKNTITLEEVLMENQETLQMLEEEELLKA